MAKGAHGGRRGAGKAGGGSSTTVQPINNMNDAIGAMRGMGMKVSDFTEWVLSDGKMFDEQLMVENTRQLMSLESKYGVIHDSASVELDYTELGKSTAFVQPASYDAMDNQKLVLDTTYFGNRTKMISDMEYSQQTGDLLESEKSMVGVYAVTHEYGHMMQHKIIANSLAKDYDSNMKLYNDGRIDEWTLNDNIYSSYLNHVTSLNNQIIDVAVKQNPSMSRSAIEKTMSTYGTSTPAEFFAEAFANANCGKPNVIGKAMQEWLRQGGYK